MLILGLTGNIGCGKSSLSNLFREQNIDVVDADIISRQIFEDRELLHEVFDFFGDSIKNIDKSLNRKALGDIVFNDDKMLLKLNSLTHPRIRDKIMDDIDKVRDLGKKIVVLDAALLIEGDYSNVVGKILVVTCDMNVQIQRIKNRDNCTRDEALSRISSQMNQIEKSRYGDYVIDNSGTLIELKNKAEEFIMYMKENWCD
ncbi:MAG: dephospho-CoA kinase [Romboutsia sp.]